MTSTTLSTMKTIVAQGHHAKKRNLLTDLIQPHMDEMWEGHDPEGDREAYEWMQSVGWENIKPVIRRLVDGLRAERERMKTRLLFLTIYQLLLTFSNKDAGRSFGNLGVLPQIEDKKQMRQMRI